MALEGKITLQQFKLIDPHDPCVDNVRFLHSTRHYPGQTVWRQYWLWLLGVSIMLAIIGVSGFYAQHLSSFCYMSRKTLLCFDARKRFFFT
jgi:hypothetical protein